ncbi:MAG: APC family permease, partial [Elusimicrobiota bacterium]
MRRELKFFDIFCLGLNSIIGSGIFLFPGLLAGHLGPASILVFPLTGLCLAPVAWCFSVLASRYDSTGGPYLYARDAFGPWAGFGIGWMCWLSNVLSYAAVANAVSSYLGHFWEPMAAVVAVKISACLVIAGLGLLNYVGVKPAVRTADAFTVAKVIPLFLFVLAGLFFIKAGRFVPFAPEGFGGLGSAVFMAFFALQGFENVPVPSGEANHARR